MDSACAGIVSDSDAVNANNVKEYVERAVGDLIKNERHSDDSMQHETLSDEQNTVVEKLIAFFDSLVLKVNANQSNLSLLRFKRGGGFNQTFRPSIVIFHLVCKI